SDGLIKLIEIHREDIESLPDLMALMRGAPYRFIVFCDDLSFEAEDTSYKSLKAMLEGGIEGRPDNVVFYATSNRRHLMSRDMMENERSTAINHGEAVEEKVSLSDRYGLWLGFHRCSQDEFLAMVDGYVAHYRIAHPREKTHREALEWATTRGARSGRVAWQYVQDLAGRLGGKLGDKGRKTENRWNGRCFADRVSGAVQEPRGVERRGSLADLEMKLRRVDVAGLAGARDHLTAFDLVAALDQELLGMGISGDVAVGVAHQNQIAVALELVAGIGHDAVFGGFDRRILRHRDIDAVVLLPVGGWAVARDHAAVCRPAELGHGDVSFRKFRGFFIERIGRRDDIRACRRLGLLRRGGSHRRFCLRGRSRHRFWLRGGCRRAGLHCRRLCARNDQAIADIEGCRSIDVVGLGDLVDRLVVVVRDFAERVACSDHMNIAATIDGGRHRLSRGGPRRGRACNPRWSIARDDQSLAGMKRRRRGDVVGLHDGGCRYPVAPCDRFDAVAGRHRN